MKKLKTTFLTVLGLALLLSLFPGSVGASTVEGKAAKKIIFQQKEITDLNVLYEKAKKEKKEKKDQNNITGKAVLKGQKGETEVEVLTTSQLLEVVEEDGVKTESYAVTSFAVPTEEEYAITASSTASESDFEYDSSYSARLNSTYYYTKTTARNLPAVKLHHAVASFTIVDSSVTLTNRQMWLGATGWTDSGYKTQVTSKYTVTGSSRSVYPPTSWLPVASEAEKRFGVNSSATVKRGTSTWTVTLHNQM